MDKFMMRWCVAVLVLVIFVVGAYFNPASAAEEVSGVLKLELNPPVIELLTEPGKSLTAEVKITNVGTGNETLRTELQTFGAQGEDGRPVLHDQAAGGEVLEWVTVSPATFTLVPNEQQVVTVTVRPPASAQFGYYFAVTFLRSSAGEALDQPGSLVTGGTATLFLLNVQVPNATRSMEVLEFSTPKTVYEYLPTKFSIRVRNTGNVHLSPRGAIFLRDSGDNKVDTVDFNVGEGNVLPGSNRLFQTAWQEGFPLLVDKMKDGQLVVNDTGGEPEQTLSWDVSKASKFRMGKYTARLVLVYNDGTRDIPLEAFVHFWVLPWKFMLAGLGVLLLVVLGIRSVVVPLFAGKRTTQRFVRRRS